MFEVDVKNMMEWRRWRRRNTARVWCSDIEGLAYCQHDLMYLIYFVTTNLFWPYGPLVLVPFVNRKMDHDSLCMVFGILFSD